VGFSPPKCVFGGLKPTLCVRDCAHCAVIGFPEWAKRIAKAAC
jgi:hypothetical protein